MYILKLIKALSYTGAVHATKADPYVEVNEKETADALIASGYFKLEEETTDAKTPDNNGDGGDDKKTINELKAIAAEKGIDLAGASRRAEIIAKIKEAETPDNNGDGNGEEIDSADYGEDE